MSDENAMANELVNKKLGKTEETPLWELGKKAYNSKLNPLTKEELVLENEKLLEVDTKKLDKKAKKRYDEIKKDLSNRINRRKLEGDTFTSPPRPEPSKDTVIVGPYKNVEESTDKTKTKTGGQTGGDNNKSDNSSVGENSKKSLEADLSKNQDKQQSLADSLNDDELGEKKLEDAINAGENAAARGDSIDDNLEFNSPNWFWEEAKEIAPNDKAKRGFLITNHIFNTLGTGLGNIGATVQNNGGSGGGTIKDYNSYLNQYSQSKMNQVLANRKAKQDSRMQFQINALLKIGATEEEALEIQNRLRNGKFKSQWTRLTNEEQMLLQALLYYDNEGKIGDALIGDMIDRMMKGDKVSAEDIITTTVTASGVDNAKTLVNGIQELVKNPIKTIGEGLSEFFGWTTPEQRAERVKALNKK
jgi:hypothetical protein